MNPGCCDATGASHRRYRWMLHFPSSSRDSTMHRCHHMSLPMAGAAATPASPSACDSGIEIRRTWCPRSTACPSGADTIETVARGPEAFDTGQRAGQSRRVVCECRQRHRQPRKAVSHRMLTGHDRPSSPVTERLINRIIHKNPGRRGILRCRENPGDKDGGYSRRFDPAGWSPSAPNASCAPRWFPLARPWRPAVLPPTGPGRYRSGTPLRVAPRPGPARCSGCSTGRDRSP